MSNQRIGFQECVIECVGNKELVKEFNRLSGCNLWQSLRRAPLDRMIDDACGRYCRNRR
jgi:hypothetical protein